MTRNDAPTRLVSLAGPDALAFVRLTNAPIHRRADPLAYPHDRARDGLTRDEAEVTAVGRLWVDVDVPQRLAFNLGTNARCPLVIGAQPGRWWPKEAACAAIRTARDPEALALAICATNPAVCGEWVSA